MVAMGAESPVQMSYIVGCAHKCGMSDADVQLAYSLLHNRTQKEHLLQEEKRR